MYILATEIGAFTSTVRAFFASIDRAIYAFITIIYNLIEDLANVSILSTTSIDQFATRVYSLIGIFMLFRISFSIITYIISPDKLTDNKSGAGSIIKRVIISLILIIFVPTGFNLLYDLQSAIFKENIIPNFILGTNQKSSQMAEKTFLISPTCETAYNELKTSVDGLKLPTVSNTGNYISLITFRNFYQLAGIKLGDDDETQKFFFYYCGYNQGNVTVGYYLQSMIYNYPDADLPSDEDSENMFEEVWTSYYKNSTSIGSWILSSFTPIYGVYTSIGRGVQAIKWINNHFFKTSLEEYYVDYSIFISTAVGIAVILFLVSMAMDVAVRSIKLAFLQLLAPIPIVSYISPDSKSNSMLKNWAMEVFRTWASLFIRLIALFFGIYLIQQLDGVRMRDGYTNLSTPFWIQFFLLIGILIFCKQMPKLLEDLIPGMKGSGTFSLRPFKKFGDEALGGKAILGTAGALGAGAIGLAGSGIAHGIARNNFKRNLAKDKGAVDDLRNQRLANASQLHSNNMQLHANRSQIKSLDSEIDQLKSKSVLSIAEASRLRDLRNQKSALESSNNDIKASNAQIRNNSKDLKRDMQAKQSAIDKKIQNSQLSRHPVAGFMGSVSRGAAYGMKEGYKNPKGFLKSGLSAIEKASQNRNYRDQYSLSDRARDRYTDIVGIKNQSGTTSEVKRDMRTATLALDEVSRNISMLERTISNYQNTMDMHNQPATIINSTNNRMIYNPSYSGPDADQIRGVMDTYNQQLDQKLEYEKQIKNYEDILNSNKKKE